MPRDAALLTFLVLRGGWTGLAQPGCCLLRHSPPRPRPRIARGPSSRTRVCARAHRTGHGGSGRMAAQEAQRRKDELLEEERRLKQYEEMKNCTFAPSTTNLPKQPAGPILVRGLSRSARPRPPQTWPVEAAKDSAERAMRECTFRPRTNELSNRELIARILRSDDLEDSALSAAVGNPEEGEQRAGADANSRGAATFSQPTRQPRTNAAPVGKSGRSAVAWSTRPIFLHLISLALMLLSTMPVLAPPPGEAVLLQACFRPVRRAWGSHPPLSA
ncbi:hypothetical protein PAPYR_3080 [Paratrimastix pyriformis]|uniref:Uncharacterized protein n=1 Tax=Paratrimastix pyriformis TaxID=342808 RepID=A0ABQ8UNR7_9EUKA|nr:hypothetical protein PAPYR_3080 [Paratrimastix pyriformis]